MKHDSSGERNNLIELEAILGRGGVLASAAERYEERPGQISMAAAVMQAFHDDLVCAVEAGTGTGKSFAYLIPSILFCRDMPDEKVVVATSTINLQHQLVDKDLPFLRHILKLPFSWELLKGRSNYICLRKLFEEVDAGLLLDESGHRRGGGLDYLRSWAAKTRTGMQSELDRHVNPVLWKRVASDKDSCLKQHCPHRDGCFVLQARLRAADADIIVVNHHLLFADMLMRESEGIAPEQAAILPPYRRLVIDEAHNIEKNATNYLTEAYEVSMLERLLHDLLHQKFGSEVGIAVRFARLRGDLQLLKPLKEHQQAIRKAADELEIRLFNLMEETGNQQQLLDRRSAQGSDKAAPFGPTAESAAELVAEIEAEVKTIAGLAQDSRLVNGGSAVDWEKIVQEPDTVGAVGFARSSDDSEEGEAALLELGQHASSMRKLSRILQRFCRMEEYPQLVFWLETRRSTESKPVLSMKITPLSVAEQLCTHLFMVHSSVILTSATLTTGNTFTYFERQTGLAQQIGDRYVTHLFPSPFDSAGRLFLGIPSDAPPPNSGKPYAEFVSEFVGKSILSTEGGTLVLFTSYALMNVVRYSIEPVLEKKGIALLVQGDYDRSKLLDRFIRDENSVLLATESFWEGIDAPGATLRAVIITRLPFRVPTDPVVAARYADLEGRGGNPFMELSLPEAALKLKQGFGRLLRSHSDRGIVHLLDSRLLNKFYGRIFLNSLPEHRLAVKPSGRLIEEAEVFLYGGH